MKIYESKTKIMHFRNTRKPRSRYSFKFGESILETVEMYKYLGVFLDEYVKFDKVASVLAESSGRALGGIISKFKNFKNTAFGTYHTLYERGVVPIMDYSASVWGFNDFTSLDVIQHRAMRYFLGVN